MMEGGPVFTSPDPPSKGWSRVRVRTSLHVKDREAARKFLGELATAGARLNLGDRGFFYTCGFTDGEIGPYIDVYFRGALRSRMVSEWLEGREEAHSVSWPVEVKEEETDAYSALCWISLSRKRAARDSSGGDVLDLIHFLADVHFIPETEERILFQEAARLLGEQSPD